MGEISYKTLLSGLVLGLVFAFPALAGDITVSDQVAHVDGDSEHDLAVEVLMTIENVGAADRIYAVRSNVSKGARIIGGMRSRSGGAEEHMVATVIDVPKDGRMELSDEGHHIMLDGLKKKVEEGDVIQITLFFEKAGRVKIDVPVKAEAH